MVLAFAESWSCGLPQQGHRRVGGSHTEACPCTSSRDPRRTAHESPCKGSGKSRHVQCRSKKKKEKKIFRRKRKRNKSKAQRNLAGNGNEKEKKKWRTYVNFIGRKVLAKSGINGLIGHVGQEDEVVHSILMGSVGLDERRSKEENGEKMERKKV